MRECMTRTGWTGLGLALFFAVAGCAADVADPSLDDPLSTEGKADGEPWCSIESIALAAPFTTIEIPSNACHDRTSTRVEIGGSESGRLLHPVLGDGAFSLGCTLVSGETDVAAPVPVEARVFSVPVTPGAHVAASLGDSSRATLDLLVAESWGEGVTRFSFVEHGSSVDVDDDGGSMHVHEKDGERFVVLRVRPRRPCPGDDHVDFELRVN